MKLSPAQKEMLLKICKTNGGGIHTLSLNGWELKTVFKLHDLGLVQGKSGNLSIVVHTREGLKAYRNLITTN